MEHVSLTHTAATIVALAVLPPSTTAAFVPAKPIPLEQIVMRSDAIVVGVTRNPEPSERDHKTIDVEQWIVPAYSKSTSVKINGGNSYQAKLGKRVLLLLRELKSPWPSADYSAWKVIDLEDSSDVARALEEMKSPWIPYVTSATSYSLLDWGDWSSHPMKVPTRDPLLLEIERILKTAWSKSDGR